MAAISTRAAEGIRRSLWREGHSALISRSMSFPISALAKGLSPYRLKRSAVKFIVKAYERRKIAIAAVSRGDLVIGSYANPCSAK